MKTRGSQTMVVAWLLTGALLVLAMVVIGGITRLTGSGLSMVEWNVISGTLPPYTEAEWQATFAQYQQFPEYQKVNFSMTLAGFKQIFWWEYLHRLLGRLLGVVFLVPFLVFMGQKRLSTPLIKRLLFILLLGMLQGLMGWLMVKSGLVDQPHVSHYRLAAHLCLALALMGTIFWTVADLTQTKAQRRPAPRSFTVLAKGVLAAIFLQIVLGAFVAGLKAGYYYNTFPLMNQEFFPEAQQEVLTWQNFLDNGSFLQFAHRWFAWLVLGLLVYLFAKSKKTPLSPAVKNLSLVLLLTGLVQVALGIATLVLQVPVLLGVLHQVVAAVLFSEAVLVVHAVRARSVI